MESNTKPQEPPVSSFYGINGVIPSYADRKVVRKVELFLDDQGHVVHMTEGPLSASEQAHYTLHCMYNQNRGVNKWQNHHESETRTEVVIPFTTNSK